MRLIDVGPQPGRSCDPRLPGLLATSEYNVLSVLTELEESRVGLVGGSALLNWSGYAADVHAEQVADVARGLEAGATLVQQALALLRGAQAAAQQQVQADQMALDAWESARAQAR